jgi:hypothetical protein
MRCICGCGNAPFRVWDDNGVVRRPRIEDRVSWVICIVPCNSIWKPATWVVVTVKHVFDTVSGLRSSQACPEDLKSQTIPGQRDEFARQKNTIGPLTAVTFGLSIQGSTLSGPTELTTTIVFLLTLAIALTRLSPFAQAVKFLRSPS